MHFPLDWRIYSPFLFYIPKNLHVTQPRKTETSPKPRRSLLGRITDGIKKITGLGKKKASSGHKAPPADAGTHPEKLHAAKSTSKRHPTAGDKLPRTDAPKGERERERRPARDGEGPRPSSRGGQGRRSERSERGGERGGERPSRGDRPERGGRGGRQRSDEPREPKSAPQNYEALPPPEPPAVPDGLFPEAFEVLGFSPAILAAIRDVGYTQPTEIQVKAAPIVLEGKDLVGASQTGTGKTAAFGMPTLTRLGKPGKLRCLILEPTRELAAQVVEAFEQLNQYTGLRTLLVHGGVGYDRQRKGLQQGCDIVVATPGRLLDFMSDGTANLGDIEVLILDEVDRMLDMGFLPDVRRIVERTPKSRQTLFFSATMPPQIKGLADWALKDPATVEVGIRFSPAETVSHYLYPIASDQREELILELLRRTDFHSVMIFTRTKMDADRLYGSIRRDGEHKVTVMHSDVSQKDREKALKGFRDGEFEIIVATDVAARGLDVSGVTHVINYMVPENPEDYVHRIGRTGRAQKEGDAFTLFAAEEIASVQSIERLIGQSIERKKLENFPYKYTTVLDNEDRARAIMFGRKGGKRRR